MAEPGSGRSGVAGDAGRIITLLHATAVAANEAMTVEEAMQTCVDAVCAHTGWPVGHFYSLAPDGSAELLPSSIWHLDDPGRSRPSTATATSCRSSCPSGRCATPAACVSTPSFTTSLSAARRRRGCGRTRERFQTAFYDAPIGMVLVDLQGPVCQANHAFSRVLKNRW